MAIAGKGILLLMILAGLSGCAAMRAQHALNTSCKTSNVLYVDLSKPQYERLYELPNGQVCPDLSNGVTGNA